MRTHRFLGRQDIADRIVRVLQRGQAGQPYLFSGPEGSGKEATALEIARLVNCSAPADCRADALCESCRKAVTFQHPDIRWIGPAPAGLEDPGKSDLVREILDGKAANPFHVPDFTASSQVLIGNPDHPGPLTVRSVIQFLRRRSFQGRWKVAVVADCQRMNTAAANAFLKTLEEPPDASLIFMLTTGTAGMLPTILSRCQQVLFEPYPEEQMAAILDHLAADADPVRRGEAVRLADGNARRALALLDDETAALRRWAEQIYVSLGEGMTGAGQAAAEHLQAGTMPASVTGGDAARISDLALKRRRAILFCETLAMLLAETVACRERGDRWRPRAAGAADLVRQAAMTLPVPGLLAAIARVEQAKHELGGNLNIGLVTAVMLQDVGDHVRA